MNKQLKAYLYDFIILILVTTPLLLIYFIKEPPFIDHINWNLKTDYDIKNAIVYCILLGYMLFFYAYFLFKDFLNISFGKRKYHLQIVDVKTNKEASGIKKIARNLSLILPPLFCIELIIKFSSPKSRFGDMVLGTEIRVKTNENSQK